MRVLKAGDTGVAIATGKGRVPVVYQYRTLRLERTGVDVPDVLVGVCPETDEILRIPAQSTPKLKGAREKKKREQFLQARLPLALWDVLDLLADRYDVPRDVLTPVLVRLYLNEAVRKERLAKRLVRLSAHRLAVASGTRTKTLKVRSSAELMSSITELAKRTKGANRSDLVRAAIVAAKEDVFDGQARERAKTLGSIAQAV